MADAGPADFGKIYANVQNNGQTNIAQVLGLVGQMYQIKDLQARQAVGEAYQSATDPQTGLTDTGKFMGLVRDNPVAALRAGEAASNAATLQGQNLTNANAKMGFVGNLVGAYLSKKGDLTEDDAASAATMAERNGFGPWARPILLGDPNVPVRQRFQTLNNIALGNARSDIVTGPPNPVSGQTGNITRGQAVVEATTPNATGTMGYPSALPVGDPELLAQSARRASDLQGTASTTAQYHADLENLKQDSKVLDYHGGPTTEVEKKFNSLSQRVLGMGVTMTPEELRAADSFDKIVNGISLRQGQAFGGTDASRNMSLAATPNLGMSRYSRDALIDMLQGNQDTVDVAREMFLKARAGGLPANAHDNFVHELTQPPVKDRLGNWTGGLDPRVFQFNRLSRKDQQTFLSQLDPDELSDFEQRYQAAIDRRWVKPLKKAQP